VSRPGCSSAAAGSPGCERDSLGENVGRLRSMPPLHAWLRVLVGRVCLSLVGNGETQTAFAVAAFIALSAFAACTVPNATVLSSRDGGGSELLDGRQADRSVGPDVQDRAIDGDARDVFRGDMTSFDLVPDRTVADAPVDVAAADLLHDTQPVSDDGRDAGDAGAEGPDAGSIESGNGTSGTCSTVGLSECRSPYVLRTCTGGHWVDTPCGALEVCVPGTPALCRTACADLAPSSGSLISCFTPYDPNGGFSDPIPNYNDQPITAAVLGSDPDVLSPDRVEGEAFDMRDQDDMTQATCASVAIDPNLGPVWRTPAPKNWYGRIFLRSFFALDRFVGRYGKPPAGISLYVKMLRTPDPNAKIPIPVFDLLDGTASYITPGEVAPSLVPEEAWAVYRRDFTSDELAYLSIDETQNWCELDLVSGLPSATPPSVPPQNVQVAWFALSFQVPL